MSERLQMQGRLSELEEEAYSLRMKIEAACRTIRAELNTTLREIEDLDIPMAAQQMRELETAFVRLQGLLSKIKQIRLELGRG